MNKGYKYPIDHCHICGKSVARNWYIQHLKKAHPLTEQEEASIRDSVVDRGYYDYRQLQHEQREEI